MQLLNSKSKIYVLLICIVLVIFCAICFTLVKKNNLNKLKIEKLGDENEKLFIDFKATFRYSSELVIDTAQAFHLWNSSGLVKIENLFDTIPKLCLRVSTKYCTDCLKKALVDLNIIKKRVKTGRIIVLANKAEAGDIFKILQFNNISIPIVVFDKPLFKNFKDDNFSFPQYFIIDGGCRNRYFYLLDSGTSKILKEYYYEFIYKLLI